MFKHVVADAFARTRGMRTRRCPHCPVLIRFRGVGPAEEKHLTDLATDHYFHGGRREY